MQRLDVGDEILSQMWEHWDRGAALAKLRQLQRILSELARDGKRWEQRKVQDLIVSDLDARRLAVEKVTARHSGPGVDDVVWRTPAQKMRAAIELNSRSYKASPMRYIEVNDRGRKRGVGLPTYKDRAMGTLWGYALAPVIEARAERKSFAFRQGRSTFDAIAYLCRAMERSENIRYVLILDVKSYYASISHDWLLEHVPMDKRVLREFLNAGVVRDHEFFPTSGRGISLGSSLSPYLGNFVLDGLQKIIYELLYADKQPSDYAVGDMIRFADDVAIALDSAELGELILDELRPFLSDRGLTLNIEKTAIHEVSEGFNWLGFFLKREGMRVTVRPMERAVEGFIQETTRHIWSIRRLSQLKIIKSLNPKLRGWANYYRFCESTRAFKRVDDAVNAALLEAACDRYPRQRKAVLLERFWYREWDGRRTYALENDKSVKLYRLSDTIQVHYHKVKTSHNAFMDEKTDERQLAIARVTGKYQGVWLRQQGRCLICGALILPDEERSVIPLDPSQPARPENEAYVHLYCEHAALVRISHYGDTRLHRYFDVYDAIRHINDHDELIRADPDDPSYHWRYRPLRNYLAMQEEVRVSLTFTQIEEICGTTLPKSAYERPSFWEKRTDVQPGIADAWLLEGYRLKRLDLKHRNLSLELMDTSLTKLKMPQKLMQRWVPEDLAFEFERHCDYLVRKYSL